MVSITAESVEAALSAIADLPDSDWQLALVFASGSDSLAAAGSGLRAGNPGLTVAGCTSAGIVDRSSQVGAEVQVTLLGGSGFKASIRTASLEEQGSRAAGSAVAGAITDLRAEHHDQHGSSVLLLLMDGLVGDTNDVVRGAYGTVGATIPIVGGCAGDDLEMVATHQLANDDVSTGTVIGIALSSSGSVGLGVDHGWVPLGQPMAVTATESTSILTLDDEPALDVYLKAIGHPEPIMTNSDLATLSQTRPFGLRSSDGYHVRFVRGGDVEQRSIEFLVAIAEGETVTLMEGDTDSVIGAVGSAVQQATQTLDTEVLGILAFDCVACRGVIGDDLLPSEIDQLAAQLPTDAVVSGLYTYGEIARQGGALGFHNQTMVVLALQ